MSDVDTGKAISHWRERPLQLQALADVVELVSPNSVTPVLPAGMYGFVDVGSKVYGGNLLIPSRGSSTRGYSLGQGVSPLVSLYPHMDLIKIDSMATASHEGKPL